MQTALAWGMAPSTFERLPHGDQIRMISFQRESSLRKAHMSHVQDKLAEEERERDRPGRRGKRTR